MLDNKEQKSNIKVACRIRPPLPREIENGQFFESIVPGDLNNNNQQNIYISLSDQPCVIPKNGKINHLEGVAKYTLNRVFDQNSTQKFIFSEIAKPCVESIFNGINSTIFAYGQTGTGKSYTIFGDERKKEIPEKQGIVPRTIYDIFEKINNQSNKQIQEIKSTDNMEIEHQEEKKEEYKDEKQKLDEEISDTETSFGDLDLETNKSQLFLSVTQIYNEQITDLLQSKNNQSQSQSQQLQIKMNKNKQYFIKNLRNIEVFSPEQALNFIKQAYTNRQTNSTNMNEVSSRSHIIITLTLNKFENDTLYSAKLNLVDLAGSEKLKASQASGQALTEACYINKSLFHFQNVIAQLEKNQKNINYRNSKLTQLLADSIGGNCQTTMIACVSPSKDFCKESNSTLNFAHKCKNIQNIVKPNRFKGSIPSSTPVKLKEKRNSQIEQKQPWSNLQLTNENQIYSDFVNLPSFGKIHLLRAGKKDNSKSVIFIHGCAQTSNSKEFSHFFPVFLHMGYSVFSIDMPGYGKSEGKVQSFRTVQILNENGPAQVIEDLLQQFNLEKPVLMGYDWGAAISLRLGIKNRNSFSHIIAFMPAYGESEQNKDELKKLNTPTMIQWVKQDQMHVWSKFKNLAYKIPNIRIDLIEAKQWKANMASNLYQALSNRLSSEIYKFILGDKIEKIDILKPLKEQTQTTHAQKVTQVKQIMFKEDLTQDKIENMSKIPTFQEANEYFKLHFNSNLTEIIQKHKNNTLPQSMEQKLYLEELQSLLKNSENQEQETMENFKVLKEYITEQIPKKKYNLSNIVPDQEYYQSFLQEQQDQKQIQSIYLPTSYGTLHIYSLCKSENKYTILAMHGDGNRLQSTGSWLPTMHQFHQQNYNILAISMPGYGESTGNQSSFRSYGKEILKEIMEKLNIQQGIIMGRSVGGRTSFEFGNSYPEKTLAIVLQHPVVPSDDIIVCSSQNAPMFLSWAKDDGEWDKERGKPNAGHPYFGPHGAVHIKKLTNCKLLSWRERDYEMGYRDYYENVFVNAVTEFLKQNSLDQNN